MRTETAAPVLARLARAMVPVVIAWTLLPTSVGPVAAQDAPPVGQVVQNGSEPEGDPGLNHFLGPWIRNDALSEDAVLK
ncbi:MAG: hypothetical protein OXG74_11375, partial [Acidobacteria bacterium]|nr:hypothetical protein [Acidobacteriota bacterium]